MLNCFKPVVWRLMVAKDLPVFSDAVIGDTFRRNKNGSVYIKVARTTFENHVNNCIMLAPSDGSTRSAGYNYHCGQNDTIFPATVEVTA